MLIRFAFTDLVVIHTISTSLYESALAYMFAKVLQTVDPDSLFGAPEFTVCTLLAGNVLSYH